MAEQVRPYPWNTLPRARRADTRLLAGMREVLRPPAIVAGCLAALGTLLSSALEAEVVSVGPDDRTPVVGSSVGLRLAVEGGAVPWCIALELEAPLAVAVVARLARRAPPRVVHAGLTGAISPAILGAFAAVVAAAVRSAKGPLVLVEPLSVVAPTASPGDVVATFALRLDGEAFHARAVFPAAALAHLSGPFTASLAATLGDAPLALPVVACRLVATGAEIAALAVGDVWMIGGAWGADSGHPMWLSAADGEVGFCCTLEADGRLVLGHGFEELSWSPMNEQNDSPTLVEAVGEVPVVVRVEVGAARMKAREWAMVSPGDVIGLGSKIGAKVTLRVSGSAVAEGDLVDIDGELGVRIRRRLGDK